MLTDINSKWTFGYCRHDPNSDTALVILSYLPWQEIFYKVLNFIALLIHNRHQDQVRVFLDKLYNYRNFLHNSQIFISIPETDYVSISYFQL